MCTHAAASSSSGPGPRPTRASSADDEQELPTRQRQHQQEQPARRRQRVSSPTSLSKMLFDWPMWSQLSSTTTSKVNTRTSDRPSKTARNRTVMTVSHDEGTQGVHVQLRREFRFVSPPALEQPVFERPRKADQLIEPGQVRDAQTEDEVLNMGEVSMFVDRMDKGKGKAVEQAVEKVGSDIRIHTHAQIMTTALGSPAERPDKGRATEEAENPARLKSEDLESARRDKATEESEDYIEGAIIAPTVRSQEKTPEEQV